MKKVLLFSILVCLFFFQGCAGGRWINIQTRPTVPYSYIKNYEIGKLQSAYIGQEIIKIKEIAERQSKRFISKQSIIINAQYKINNYQIKSEANKEYQSNETIAIVGRTYYVIKLFDDKDSPWGILVSTDGVIFSEAIYSYNNEMLFYPSKIKFTPDVLDISFSTQKEKNIPLNEISYELIYSGKNDVSLNITYREYTPDNLARAAFFQNLTYQANAKQIRFKDFLIQIHNVTNEQITYTVIEDGLK